MKSLKKIEWIFFDLGWTLVDETQAHRVRLEKVAGALLDMDRKYSVDRLIRLCEEASTEFAASPFYDMLERLQLSNDQVIRLREVGHYAHECERLYPGVPELLHRLKSEHQLGVLANQSAGTEQRLVNWGIRDCFSLVFSSSEYGLEKPDPRIFEAALIQAGCTPGEALMVGDRLDNDIGPANAQGWQTLRILQGFSRYQQPRWDTEVPDVEIASIDRLSINKQVNRES